MAQIKVNIELSPDEYDRFLIFRELITSNYVSGKYKYQLSDSTKGVVCEKYESVLEIVIREYMKYKKPTIVSELSKTKEYQFDKENTTFKMAIIEKE